VTAWRERVRLSALGSELERAHRHAVRAATAGLQDSGLGALRLTGSAVPTLADAAVSSATPFLRAPLLSRLSRVRLLHPSIGVEACPTCDVAVPCPTAQEVDG
jgi:hypothetical protein